MALMDWLQGLFTPGQTTSVAQDRYTHTPLALGTYPDLMNKNMIANYSTQRTWGDLANYRGVGLAGMPASAASIQANTADPQYNPSMLRHEIIHAATMGDLKGDQKLYNQIGAMLPEGVKNKVNYVYQKGNIPYDVVHEGVPFLLTDDSFSGKEYNAAKLKIINAFPQATRNKLIRIMGAQQPDLMGGQNAQ